MQPYATYTTATYTTTKIFKFMKKFFTIISVAILAISALTSCSKDEQKIENLYGIWVCTYSLDQDNEDRYENVFKDEILIISPQGKYTSTSSEWGYSGTYAVLGNKIKLINSSGEPLSVKFSVNSKSLTLSGNAYGYDFTYKFSRVTE